MHFYLARSPKLLFILIAASDMNCFKNIMQDFDDQIRNCSCEVDCEENDYDIHLSQAKWPSRMYEVNIN